MDKKIAVLGAGAIGGSIGADLTLAGQDVVLIDGWAAHVEAMKVHGLRVALPAQELHAPVRALHLCDVSAQAPQFDIVLMAAKSYDSRWLAQFIKPYLKSDGVLVCVQNSLNDEWVAPIIGYTRDIGCTIELSAEVFTPGVIQRNTDHQKTWFGLGELNGRITPRLREIEALMQHSGRVTLTENIWGLKWTKLINSTMMLGTLGVLGLNACEATRAGVIDLLIKIGRESVAVGRALGYTTEAIFGMPAEAFAGATDDVLKKNLETIVGFIGKKARGVVLQDFIKQRPSEATYFNGLVAAKGVAAAVPTPFNNAVLQLVARIERGECKPALENLATIQQLAGQA
jgi:2-dehydropantoate 2-reductase